MFLKTMGHMRICTFGFTTYYDMKNHVTGRQISNINGPVVVYSEILCLVYFTYVAQYLGRSLRKVSKY